MSHLTKTSLYLLYLTLGTYAVPEFRLGVGRNAVPYAVPLSVVLIILVTLQMVECRGRIKISYALVGFTYMYLLGTVLSTAFAKQPNLSLTAKYSLMAMLPLLVALIASDRRTLDVALGCLLLTSIAVLAYGAYGYFTGNIGDPVEHTLGYFGVTYTQSTRNSDMLYIQTLIWLLFALLLTSPKGTRKHPLLTLLLVALLISSVAAVIMSLVRGTWVTVILVLGSLWLSIRKHVPVLSVGKGLWWALALAAVAGIMLLLPEDPFRLVAARWESLFRLSDEGGNSNAARIALTSKVLQIIVAHPITGVGVGNLRFHLADFAFGSVNHAENVYLQLLTEQGVLGFIAFLGLLLWTSRGLYQGLRRVTSATEAAPFLALLGITINWAAYGVFNNLVDNVWFWSVFGLAAAVSNQIENCLIEAKSSTRPAKENLVSRSVASKLVR